MYDLNNPITMFAYSPMLNRSSTIQHRVHCCVTKKLRSSSQPSKTQVNKTAPLAKQKLINKYISSASGHVVNQNIVIFDSGRIFVALVVWQH